MASEQVHSYRPHPPIDSDTEKIDQYATILTDHFNAAETSSAAVKNIERGNFIPSQPHLIPPLPPLIPLPNFVTVGTLGPRGTPIASTDSIVARAKEYDGNSEFLPSNTLQKPDRPERFGPPSLVSSREENQDHEPKPRPDNYPSFPPGISNALKLPSKPERFYSPSVTDNLLDREQEPDSKESFFLPLHNTHEFKKPNRPDHFGPSHAIFTRRDEPTASFDPNDMTNLQLKSMIIVAISVGSFIALMIILIISCICTKKHIARHRATRKVRILAADPENKEGRPEERVNCMCGDPKPTIILPTGIRYAPQQGEYCRTWEEHIGKRYHGATFSAAMKRCEIKRLMKEIGLENRDVPAGRSEWNISMGGYSADGTAPTKRVNSLQFADVSSVELRSTLDRGKGIEMDDLDLPGLTRRANDLELQNLDRPAQKIFRERKGRYTANPVYKIGPMRTASSMNAQSPVASGSGLTPEERSLDLASVEKREAEQREAGELFESIIAEAAQKRAPAHRSSTNSTTTSTTTLESIFEEPGHEPSIPTLASLPEVPQAAEKETTGKKKEENLTQELDSRQPSSESPLKSTDQNSEIDRNSTAETTPCDSRDGSLKKSRSQNSAQESSMLQDTAPSETSSQENLGMLEKNDLSDLLSVHLWEDGMAKGREGEEVVEEKLDRIMETTGETTGEIERREEGSTEKEVFEECREAI